MLTSLNTKTETKPISPWLKVHPALGISMIDHLYNELEGMYMGKWTNQFKNEVSIQSWRETWAKAFDKEKISTKQVSTGIDECRKLYAYPPSIKEFLDACRTVIPQAHRDFPPALTHKQTPEERRACFARFKEAAKEMLSRVPA